MSEPFVGEIRLWALPFAPNGWASCDGQLLSIQQNAALFSLLGTMYGGNGTTNFSLPDFRGRTLMHRSTTDSAYQQGSNWAGGTETVAFTNANSLLAHTHGLAAINSTGTTNAPASNWLAGAAATTTPGYTATKPAATVLSPSTVTSVGAAAPQDNTQPSLVINFCIALRGYFPSRE